MFPFHNQQSCSNLLRFAAGSANSVSGSKVYNPERSFFARPQLPTLPFLRKPSTVRTVYLTLLQVYRLLQSNSP